jgi:protein-tyrosine kinase
MHPDPHKPGPNFVRLKGFAIVSIIEQAARRLDELRRAGIEATPPHRPDGTGEPSPAVQQRTAPPAEPRQRVHLDLAALAARGFATPEAPRTRLADEFRHAKRPLLANARGQSAAPVKRANCIMVTSSLPGEGKTFTAINLALSLATEVDSHVVLVDADVMRPSVLGRLGLPLVLGLLDVLTDPAMSLPDVILRTNIGKLSLVPAGSPRSNATELLASAGMGRLVEELASPELGRIVVFDTPPLLAAPETRALAAHVGQIVLVVEANRTPQSAVREALEQVKDCPVVMTLLNKARGAGGASYGYGSYGYGPS